MSDPHGFRRLLPALAGFLLAWTAAPGRGDTIVLTNGNVYRGVIDRDNTLVPMDQLTQALVAHTIARLQFWDNMGILYIKEDGQWEDMEEPPRMPSERFFTSFM